MPTESRAAGRPRDASVDAALLTATEELLVEQGFDRLSMDAVAARAGIGKAAIYRRWSGKTALVVAAVASLARAPELPDTGSLRGDLLAAAGTYVRDQRTQRVLAGLMTAMVHNDELRAAARRAIGEPFSELFRGVIARGIARGQVRASASAASVGEVFPAMAFHRGAALGLPVDEEFVIEVVDSVLLPLLVP